MDIIDFNDLSQVSLTSCHESSYAKVYFIVYIFLDFAVRVEVKNIL